MTTTLDSPSTKERESAESKELQAPKRWKCYAKAQLPEACSKCIKETSLKIFAAIPAITKAKPHALLTYPRTYSKDVATTLTTNANTYLDYLCGHASFTNFFAEELP